jgi:hypothetical protein
LTSNPATRPSQVSRTRSTSSPSCVRKYAAVTASSDQLTCLRIFPGGERLDEMPELGQHCGVAAADLRSAELAGQPRVDDVHFGVRGDLPAESRASRGQPLDHEGRLQQCRVAVRGAAFQPDGLPGFGDVEYLAGLVLFWETVQTIMTQSLGCSKEGRAARSRCGRPGGRSLRASLPGATGLHELERSHADRLHAALRGGCR